MIQEIVFQIAKRRISTGVSGPANYAASRSSTQEYADWREQTLEDEFLENFSPDIVKDKDILDFGCGNGALSFLMVRLGAKSCIGVDLDQRSIDIANDRARGKAISFKHASSTTRIDLADHSIDVIVCFDVMEHIMEYKSIMGEWHRVLRPGGKVLIHWQPWFHPYGHHGQDYLPIPWVHVFLNSRQRSEVSARIVDLPEFDAPSWDYDENNNRINRFREAIKQNRADREGFLNKLTMWKFEHLCEKVGLNIERQALKSFQGPFIVRKISLAMTKVPGMREFFTANVVYVLSKPNG